MFRLSYVVTLHLQVYRAHLAVLPLAGQVQYMTHRHLTMSRDISGCPNLGRRALLASSGQRPQDSTTHPIMHKAVTATRIIYPQTSIEPRLKILHQMNSCSFFFLMVQQEKKKGGGRKILHFDECTYPDFLHPIQIQELESTRVPLSRAKCRVEAGLLGSNSCLSSKERQL